MQINLNKTKELLSKEKLFKYITDLEVYQKYIDTDEELELNKAILSPLRRENNPSFAIFMGRNNEIMFKDFLLGSGDCIRFVQMKFGCTWFEAISQIAVDFGMGDDFICKKMNKFIPSTNKSSFSTREDLLSRVTSFKLSKKARPFALHDIMYWQGFGISVETLKRFNVQAVDYVFINDKIHKADKYAYAFIELKDGKETYKIYQPFNENYKWISSHNDSVWQGWNQLPASGHQLIVTKSLKDVMSLYEVMELPAVALQSENIIPKQHVFEELGDRFGTKYALYDNDFDKETNWGKIFGEKIASTFGLLEMYIPDEYQCKDFSDLVKKVGREKAREILLEQMSVPF